MTHPSTRAPTRTFTPQVQKETGPVIVALKPNDGGDAALAMAQWLAGREQRELHVLSVTENVDLAALVAGTSPVPADVTARERAELEGQLREQCAAGTFGSAPTRVEVLEGAAAATIAHTARDRGARAIVIGTGRHGVLGRFLYGERALEVVRGAVGPVLVVPPTAMPPVEHAIVAVDFSQASLRAAVSALEMLGPGGRLTLLHVKSALRLAESSVDWWNEAYEHRARDMFARFTAVLPSAPGVAVESEILPGDPVDTLVRYASEHGVQLLACGRRRHSLVERLLVGSVSTALVRRAPCSVLVAPERPYDKELDDGAWITGVTTTRTPEEWPEFLRALTERNMGRRATLVVEKATTRGAESLEKGYVLLGVEYDRRDARADVMLGDPEMPGRHLTHRMAGLRAMEMVTDPLGHDTTLWFDAVTGRCTLTFDDAP